MDKIIVPIDFSEYSEYALETAANLAKKHHAELIVLHMLELSYDRLTDSGAEQNEKAVFFLKMAEKRFEEFLDREALKGIDVIPMVKHYKVFKELNEVAENHSVDLIVMGSHGSGGLSEMFVGSNTEKVIRHSSVPVLVVKSKPKTEAYRTGVFACDFTEEMITAFNTASRFFEANGIKMNLVYVNTPGGLFQSSDQIETRVSQFFNNEHVLNTDKVDINYISDYSIEEGIFKYAEKHQSDLIAMPTHGRTGVSHFFAGSITEDIANHSKIPVLSIRI